MDVKVSRQRNIKKKTAGPGRVAHTQMESLINVAVAEWRISKETRACHCCPSSAIKADRRSNLQKQAEHLTQWGALEKRQIAVSK